MILGSILISSNKVYVDGVLTTNPTLIGLAVLDAMESKKPMKEFEDSKSHLLAYIKMNRLRSTPERVEILKMIHQSKEPVGVETLLRKMHKRGFAVSKATIYNTLDILQKCDLLKKLPLTNDMKSAKFELR